MHNYYSQFSLKWRYIRFNCNCYNNHVSSNGGKPCSGVFSLEKNAKNISPSPSSSQFIVSDPIDDKVCTNVNGKILCAGQSIMAVVDPYRFDRFMTSNTACLFASLGICLILISGIRLEPKLFMWLTLTAFSYTYLVSLAMVCPDYPMIGPFSGRIIIAWTCMLIFVVVCHVTSLGTCVVKYLHTKVKKIKQKRSHNKNDGVIV